MARDATSALKTAATASGTANMFNSKRIALQEEARLRAAATAKAQSAKLIAQATADAAASARLQAEAASSAVSVMEDELVVANRAQHVAFVEREARAESRRLAKVGVAKAIRAGANLQVRRHMNIVTFVADSLGVWSPLPAHNSAVHARLCTVL